MGTNYYLLRDKCKCCGRAEKLHIGKSSGGWCFGLHVKDPNTDEDLPANLMEWEELFKNNDIMDEYGKSITKEEMMEIITDREFHGNHAHDPRFYIENAAIIGPNNLLRHKIAYGYSCIGHGSGTWDLIIGEFS